MNADAPEVPGDTLRSRAVEMLGASRAILSGETDIPARRRARSAALLARTALELGIEADLASAGMPITAAGMRVKLICLRVARPKVAVQAEVTWAGLSRACHHHAFELTPTDHEVAHLLRGVEYVLDRSLLEGR